jgi:phosphonate transport system permease protein
MTDRERQIAALRRERPRSAFLRVSSWALLAVVAAAWTGGGFIGGETWSPRRAENLRRFLGEVVPWPLRGEAWNWHGAWSWAAVLWHDHFAAAAATTLAISVLAILLAAMAAAGLSLAAARTVSRPDPFLTDPRPPRRVTRLIWSTVVWTTRALLIGLRSIPEYVWAFLLLAVYGPGAWPLVLALALHNAGILGKLAADMLENLPPAALAALRGLGATRAQVAAAAIFPLSANRFLLYVLYRWETCVREATVLGMVGMVSLGFWIQDARARNRYDEMVLGVAIGAAMVILGDAISAAARALVRRA